VTRGRARGVTGGSRWRVRGRGRRERGKATTLRAIARAVDIAWEGSPRGYQPERTRRRNTRTSPSARPRERGWP
jgi:hypothetical protein